MDLLESDVSGVSGDCTALIFNGHAT